MTALPTSLEVRPLRIDVDVLPLLYLLADAETVDNSGELLSEERLRLYLSLPGHNLVTDRWVIARTETDVLVGHAALQLPSETDDRQVADGTLVVHPAWRRQGLGKALFSKIEKRLEPTPDIALRVYLDPRHQAAVAFAVKNRLEASPADTYTEMHAVLADVTVKPVLPNGFTLRSYRDVNHLPTLVEAFNRSFEGLSGHHRTTAAEFAPMLADLDPDGLFLLFAPNGSVAGEVSAELAPDLTERNSILTGRVDSPGVVPEYRSLELYGALLLSGAAYLKKLGAVKAVLQSWGDAPETIELYTSLEFRTVQQQLAYQREAS